VALAGLAFHLAMIVQSTSTDKASLCSDQGYESLAMECGALCAAFHPLC